MLANPSRRSTERPERPVIRYAVAGLGWFAQAAVLPAFARARRNSALVALVSGDAEKRDALARRYRVKTTASYEEYEECLRRSGADAVYIALPNSMHFEYTVRALRAGKHVLCEKPLAVTEEECDEMIRTAEETGRKLMTAYRLHFEPANLEAVEIVQSGRLGDVRFFHGVLSNDVREGDIRLQHALGGGTLYDIGIYPINAARSHFRAEPLEVTALSANNGEERFREVDEMTSAVMRFPGERLACFTSSFGASDVSAFRVVGTEGDLLLENAFEFKGGKTRYLSTGKRTRVKNFPPRDQVAPEILYFSGCILEDRQPEPSGWEGLADVRVIRALYRSAVSREPVGLAPFTKLDRPGAELRVERPPVEPPKLLHAEPPNEGG